MQGHPVRLPPQPPKHTRSAAAGHKDHRANTGVWRSPCGDLTPPAVLDPRFAQSCRMSPCPPTSAPDRRSGQRLVSKWRATLRTGELTHTEAHTGDRMDGDGAISQSASPSSFVVSRPRTASLTVLLQCHMRGFGAARPAPNRVTTNTATQERTGWQHRLPVRGRHPISAPRS